MIVPKSDAEMDTRASPTVACVLVLERREALIAAARPSSWFSLERHLEFIDDLCGKLFLFGLLPDEFLHLLELQRGEG